MKGYTSVYFYYIHLFLAHRLLRDKTWGYRDKEDIVSALRSAGPVGEVVCYEFIQ